MPQVTRLQKPCIGYYDKTTHTRVPCGKLCARSRCDEHEALYQKTRRPSAKDRGYDSQYRKDRAALLAPDPTTGARVVCELQLEGCTMWADTADHVDPLDGGRNRAARRGELVPACKHCNSKRGSRSVFTGPSTGRRLEVPGDVTRTSADTTRGQPGDDIDGGVLMPDGSIS